MIRTSKSQMKSLQTLIALGGKVDVSNAIPGINRAGLVGMGKLGLLIVNVETCMIEVTPAGYAHAA